MLKGFFVALSFTYCASALAVAQVRGFCLLGCPYVILVNIFSRFCGKACTDSRMNWAEFGVQSQGHCHCLTYLMNTWRGCLQIYHMGFRMNLLGDSTFHIRVMMKSTQISHRNKWWSDDVLWMKRSQSVSLWHNNILQKNKNKKIKMFWLLCNATAQGQQLVILIYSRIRLLAE